MSVETTDVTLHGDEQGLTFTDPSLSGSASFRYVVPQTAISLYGLLLGAQRRGLEARVKEREEPDSEWYADLRDAMDKFADLQGVAICVGEDGNDPTV